MMAFLKQHIYIILGSLCLVAMGVLFFVNTGPFSASAGRESLGISAADAVNINLDAFTVPADSAPAYVVVHVLGAVYAPGVFSLPANARVVDAVAKAGGYTGEADLMRLNLAAPLFDAMQIIVPAAGDYSVVPAGGQGAGGVFAPGNGNTPNDGLLCLNTATLAELQTLPNIGPARAQSIIDYRESAGGFSRVEELLNISGIGNTIFGRLEPLVTVR